MFVSFRGDASASNPESRDSGSPLRVVRNARTARAA